jgi:hypothetical protein
MASYEQTDEKSLYLPDAVAAGADISGLDCATILAAAKASAAKLGAIVEQIMQGGQFNHDVGFYPDWAVHKDRLPGKIGNFRLHGLSASGRQEEARVITSSIPLVLYQQGLIQGVFHG